MSTDSKGQDSPLNPAARVRNAFHRGDCMLAWQCIDVANGRVLRSFVDLHLPGLIPLSFVRHYASSWSQRDSVFGFGWSHAYDQALIFEPGKIVYLDDEGREIEFPIDEPNQGEIFQPLHGLRLVWLEQMRWKIINPSGEQIEFRLSEKESTKQFGDLASKRQIARLQPLRGAEQLLVAHIHTLCSPENQILRFVYNLHNLLTDIVDSSGRTIHLVYDEYERVSELMAPHPSQRSQHVYAKYIYSAFGDLLEVHDSLGNTTKFSYQNHLLIEEKDRTGHLTHFAYDAPDASARCLRLWHGSEGDQRQLAYLPEQQLTVVTNSLGHATTYQTNAEGTVITKIIDALGASTSFSYDAFLRKTAEIDAQGRQNSFSYDARGNCIKLVSADGSTLEMTYNELGQPVLIIDQAGGRWELGYDQQGRLISLKNPLGELTQYEYQASLLRRVLQPGDNLVTLEYDEQQNLSRVRLADGSDLRYSYDLLGRVFQLRDIRGNVQRYYYDAAFRLVRIEEPTGNVQTLNYDQEGYLIESRDYFHHRHFSYTSDHALTAFEEAHEKIQLRYNTEGELIQIVNENGQSYSFDRDPCGRVIKEHGFDGQTWAYQRNSLGQIIKATAPDAQFKEYHYSPSGRIEEILCSDGSFSRFRYRSDGAIIEAQNENTKVRFERDLLGRITKEHQGEHWVGYTYDEQGNLTAIASSLGADLKFRRTGLGKVEQVTARSGVHKWHITYNRDVSGLEVERHLPGGLIIHWDRDQLGRPQKRMVTKGGQPVISTLFYEWTDDNRISSMWDSDGHQIQFQHDVFSRLLSAQHNNNQFHFRIPDIMGQTYRSPERLELYGPNGELLEDLDATYVYSPAGFLLRKAFNYGALYSYSYDGLGNLRKVLCPDGKEVTFTYDPFGRRISKKTAEQTVSWIWLGDTPLHEISPKHSPLTWIFEPHSFALLAMIQSGYIYSMITDHLGTPTHLYEESGTLGWHAQLDLHGDVIDVIEESSKCNWRWPGQYEDQETGLYYNRLRYYDPQMGRYISPSPLGAAGGLNIYGYSSDPLTICWPLGIPSPPTELQLHSSPLLLVPHSIDYLE